MSIAPTKEKAIAKVKAWFATPLGKVELKTGMVIALIGSSRMFHQERRDHQEAVSKLPLGQQPLDASRWHKRSRQYLSESLCDELEEADKSWEGRRERAKLCSPDKQAVVAVEIEAEFNEILVRHGYRPRS